MTRAILEDLCICPGFWRQILSRPFTKPPNIATLSFNKEWFKKQKQNNDSKKKKKKTNQPTNTTNNKKKPVQLPHTEKNSDSCKLQKRLLCFIWGCDKRRLLQTQAVIVGTFAERWGADSFPEYVFSNYHRTMLGIQHTHALGNKVGGESFHSPYGLNCTSWLNRQNWWWRWEGDDFYAVKVLQKRVLDFFSHGVVKETRLFWSFLHATVF